MNKYKTFEELKEELGNNYDLFMYEINLQLLIKIDKAVEYIKEHTFQEEIGFDNKKGKIHYGYFVECIAKDLLDILNSRSDE